MLPSITQLEPLHGTWGSARGWGGGLVRYLPWVVKVCIYGPRCRFSFHHGPIVSTRNGNSNAPEAVPYSYRHRLRRQWRDPKCKICTRSWWVRLKIGLLGKGGQIAMLNIFLDEDLIPRNLAFLSHVSRHLCTCVPHACFRSMILWPTLAKPWSYWSL